MRSPRTRNSGVWSLFIAPALLILGFIVTYLLPLIDPQETVGSVRNTPHKDSKIVIEDTRRKIIPPPSLELLK